MTVLITLGLLIVGTVLLVYGADWFLDGASDVARGLGISALVVGVVLAGLEPEEMLTAAIASARGAPALAVGNVVGTNVTIVTVALGLSSLIFPIVLSKQVRREALIATLVSLLPIVLLFTGVVTRLEGILLLIIFVGYTVFLLRTDRQAVERKAMEEGGEKDDEADEEGPHARKIGWKTVALTVGGLAALGIGGPAIVEGALRLAQFAGLSQGVVGATIVSLGTGAEMIALGVTAARKKQADILVGGIIGSFAYNLLVTLGLAATIRQVPVDVHLLRIALPVMVAAHLVLLALIWYGKMNRLMGGIFIAAYVAYLFGVVLV